MKTELYLKTILSQVINSLLPVSVLKNSFFVNDVEPDIVLYSNENVVSSLLRRELIGELFRSDCECIRISASIDNEVIRLTVLTKGCTSNKLVFLN